MRALVVHEYGPYDSHRLHDNWPAPVPGPGEVLVRTRAMSVNFPDVLMVEGGYQHRPTPPVVPGFDASGVVEAVGEDVTRVAPGDRVLVYTVDGAFAEKLVAPAHSVWKMPDQMPFNHGAAFGLAYLTAHISLIENAAARAGEWALVTGASGGVGMAMLQYGSAHGINMIAGVTSAEKAALARASGAKATINLAAPDLRDSLRKQVFDIVPEGVDLVIDMVGGPVFDAALRAIRVGGRIAIVGFAGGEIQKIDPIYLLNKQITVIGSPLGRGRADYFEMRDRAMTALLVAYEAGDLIPHISATYPLADWQNAFGRFKTRSVVGKIILEP